MKQLSSQHDLSIAQILFRSIRSSLHLIFIGLFMCIGIIIYGLWNGSDLAMTVIFDGVSSRILSLMLLMIVLVPLADFVGLVSKFLYVKLESSLHNRTYVYKLVNTSRARS